MTTCVSLVKHRWRFGALTLHVVRLERFTDVQRGHAEQHVRLQGLVAPHAKHQFAEGSHDPVETSRWSV